MKSIQFKQKKKNMDGQLFEELFFEFIEKKYSISKKDFLTILEKKQLEEKQNTNNGIPITILNNKKLSSLETIVKFLRENKKLSYKEIGKLLSRNSQSLAVSYAISRKKMPEIIKDVVNSNTIIIPFIAFSSHLSILESICEYLHSQNHSYADISRMLNLNPRTVWTVCHRARIKLSKINSSNKNHLENNNLENNTNE